MVTAQLLAALADVPFLEQLHIVGEPSLDDQQRGDPAFLAHPRPASDRADPALCPRLRRLELSDFKQISDETIREFIISRTGPFLELFQGKTAQTVVPLSHFRCALHRFMQQDILSDLQSLAAGCVVDIKYQIHMISSSPYFPLEGADYY
jgi:hypothetical protein